MTKFHDLDFKSLKDGSIRLTQTDCGEDSIIDASPEQLLFIARSLCGLKPETAGRIAELERRIAVLTDKLQHFVCNSSFRSDIIERCGYGFEYVARLDALLDLALEFDGGRLTPEYKDDDPPEADAIDEKPESAPVMAADKKTSDEQGQLILD